MYLTDFQTLLPPFVLLPSLFLAELENCCLTQAVTHTSSLTPFSDLHFSPVLCSPEYTHSLPFTVFAVSYLETSPAAGFRCQAPASTTQEKDLWASEKIYCSRS